MTGYVVDVNVGIVANGGHPPASATCRLACVEGLCEARQGIVCLDDGDRILGEYRAHLSPSGQPGVGDEFMYWILQNQFSQDRCERVPIHELPTDDWTFEEFPEDPDLDQFDRSDRKYVAVALASVHDPEVLNASDSDWWIFRGPLKRNGVNVRFLCPSLMQRSRRRYRRKDADR